MSITTPAQVAKPPFLFDDLKAWVSEPELVFTAWLVSHPIQPSTRQVKNFMWGKWCRWIKKRDLSLEQVECPHIGEFFDDEKIIKGQRYRYIRLIEAVFSHLRLLGLHRPNPGTQAALNHLGKGANDPTAFLTREEKSSVEKIINEWMMESMSEQGSCRSSSTKPRAGRGRKQSSWVKTRDASICSLILGAGVTVWGLERLTVSCTNCNEGYLSLPRTGGPNYEALLLPVGQRHLEAWLHQRRLLGPVIGDWMYPANQAARKNPTTLTRSAGMHPSSIFRAVRRVLQAAGITGARACGQTLRNSYAASLIDLGFTDSEVATYMGFHDLISAVRLRSNWSRTSHICVS